MVLLAALSMLGGSVLLVRWSARVFFELHISDAVATLIALSLFGSSIWCLRRATMYRQKLQEQGPDSF